VLFSKKPKKWKVMKNWVDDPGGPGSPAAGKQKQKTVPSPEEKEEKKNRKREGPTSKAARKTTVQRDGGESLSS
jgi:hypothetical protein